MNEIDVHNEEQLRYLNKMYEDVIRKLNDAIMELGQAKAQIQVLDAKVKKLSNDKELIKENIMCEKKIFDALRR